MERQSGPMCEECGYALDGLVTAAPPHLCPECGTPFLPADPWIPRKRPPLPMIALRLCGPMVVLLACFLGASALGPIRGLLVWSVWLLWIGAMIGVGFFWPAAEAKKIASMTSPLQSRAAAAAQMFWPALMFNVFAESLALAAFFALL